MPEESAESRARRLLADAQRRLAQATAEADDAKRMIHLMERVLGYPSTVEDAGHVLGSTQADITARIAVVKKTVNARGGDPIRFGDLLVKMQDHYGIGLRLSTTYQWETSNRQHGCWHMRGGCSPALC